MVVVSLVAWEVGDPGSCATALVLWPFESHLTSICPSFFFFNVIICKVFMEFVTIFLLFYVLAARHVGS